MEFTVSLATSADSTFRNERLQLATTRILQLGETIKKNWFEIAALVAQVDSMECYKDDGFNSVHEWVHDAFGIKKTASYTLLSIGKDYVSEIKEVYSGKTIGWGTNLVPHTLNPVYDKDFSKTQVEKMLPLGHQKAVELVNNSTITPYMTAKEISKIVKEYTAEPADSENGDEEPEEEVEVEKEDPVLTVWDASGMRYNVPLSILNDYLFGPDPARIPDHIVDSSKYTQPTDQEIEEMEQYAAEQLAEEEMEQLSIE